MRFPSTSALRGCVHAVIGAAAVSVIFYICAFKIIDSDFFWHVKAGELMWKTGALIGKEPFSYVLADKPYAASHEWLAQIIFYLVYRSGGVTASILLRGLLAAASAVVLLCIDRRSVLPNAALVVVAFYIHRPSLMVRPQLFTLLCFSLSLLLIFSRRMAMEDGRTPLSHRAFLLCILLIQIFWVNVHGASAVFGVLCVGALFLQSAYDWYWATAPDEPARKAEMRFVALLLTIIALALLASPNLFKTFVDMYNHRYDPTIPLVREWMPLIWHDYLTDVCPFAVIAFALLLWRRRSWVFCAVLLLVMCVLSLQAYRHCIVFVLACLGVSFYQLRAAPQYRRAVDALFRWPFVALVAGMSLLLVLFAAMYAHDGNTLRREDVFGFGIQMPVEGAFDFVERKGITGTLFNTYNEGGYLLFRAAPERRVFADGRNIDYGYPFLQKILDAGTNPARWKEIDNQYRFTYAVVEYKADDRGGELLPYVSFLSANPSWVLVYVDDWAAVYVRNLPQYSSVIAQDAYHIVSPAALEFSDVLEKIPSGDWPAAEQELKRVIAGSPGSIKARLLLGNRALSAHRTEQAQAIALAALRAQPNRPEVHELLGMIGVENQDWSQAGAELERAVDLTGGVGPKINYDFLAKIFSKAGQNDKAEKYHRMAVAAGEPSFPADDQ